MSKDFTSGNPTKLMLRFALPLVLSMIMQNLYNTVGMIIVGRYVGEEALAAVGTTGSVSMLVLMLITGATMGMSVVVSQFCGAKDEIMVKKAVVTSFYIIVLLSLVFSIGGALFARELLGLIRVPANIMEDAVVYLRIILLGNLATAIYNMVASMSRAMGDSLTPMIILVFSSCLNIALSVLFVSKLTMGVAGVAYATVIASAVSAVVIWVITWKKMPILRPTRETLKPDLNIAKMVARVGIPSAMQSSSMAFSNIFIQTLINGFGSTVIAAFSAATKIEALLAYAPGGITQAMQIFTGQNVGAGQFVRVRQGFRGALKAISIYSVFSLVALIAFGKPLMGIFTTEGGAMIEVGQTYLIISAIGTIACGVLFLTRSTLAGAGDSVSAIIVSVIELVGRIGGSYILSYFFGYAGAFAGTLVGWTLGAMFGLLRYKNGKWMEKGVVKPKGITAEAVGVSE